MERLILRGLLYLFLPYTFFAFTGPSSQYGVEECVRTMPIVIVLAGLAISAHKTVTLKELVASPTPPQSKPPTERRREAV